MVIIKFMANHGSCLKLIVYFDNFIKYLQFVNLLFHRSMDELMMDWCIFCGLSVTHIEPSARRNASNLV